MSIYRAAPPAPTAENAGWAVVRSGAASSPLVVHVPHASTWLPPAARHDLLLDDAGLETELRLMTDKFTDRLASAALAAAGVAATLFVNRASRLLIDPERFLSEDEPMRAVGMGAVYQSTSSKAPLRAPDPQRDQRLIESWFHPYARAFTELIDNTLAEHGRAVIVDLHSFPREPLPYELDQSAMRPSICIGTDPFHTPPPLRQLTFAAFADPAWTIVENTPFAGSYVPLEHYGVTRAVSSVMVELRRDLYQQEPGGPPHAGFAHVVDHLSRFFHALADQAPES